MILTLAQTVSRSQSWRQPILPVASKMRLQRHNSTNRECTDEILQPTKQKATAQKADQEGQMFCKESHLKQEILSLYNDDGKMNPFFNIIYIYMCV